MSSNVAIMTMVLRDF